MRVAPSLYDPLRERLDSVAAGAGYAGRIVLLAEEAIAPGDAKIEWAEGGAERNLSQQCADIDALLERCAASAEPPKPLSA
jgi:flagellar assembly protein FliH